MKIPKLFKYNNLLISDHYNFPILFSMSESKEYTQPLFTENIATKQAFDDAKMSGKLWLLDSAPSELVNDIQHEFFHHKSKPADMQQGNNLRE